MHLYFLLYLKMLLEGNRNRRIGQWKSTLHFKGPVQPTTPTPTPVSAFPCSQGVRFTKVEMPNKSCPGPYPVFLCLGIPSSLGAPKISDCVKSQPAERLGRCHVPNQHESVTLCRIIIIIFNTYALPVNSYINSIALSVLHLFPDITNFKIKPASIFANVALGNFNINIQSYQE